MFICPESTGGPDMSQGIEGGRSQNKDRQTNQIPEVAPEREKTHSLSESRVQRGIPRQKKVLNEAISDEQAKTYVRRLIKG